MKSLLKLICLSSIAFAIGQNSDDDKNFYSKRYDSLDVDTIFRSSRLLNNYVDCLLDKKFCTAEGRELKRILPHALRTSCIRCTKIQKEKALDVITRLYYQHPSIYIALAERYDAEGTYTRNFENWFDEQQKEKLNGQLQNEVPQRVRIPSTWITSSTTQKPTTERVTPLTMRTLRTLSTTVRTFTKMEKTSTLRSVISSTESATLSQKSSRIKNTKKVSTISPSSLKLTSQAPIMNSSYQLTTSTLAPQLSTQIKNVPFVPMKIPNQNQFKPLTSSTSVRPFIQQQLFPEQSFQSPMPNRPGFTSSISQNSPSRFPSAPSPQVPTSVVNKDSFSVPFSMPREPAMPAPSTFRTPSVQRPVERPLGGTFPIDPNLIDNFFVPRNVQIQRSINQIFDRTNLMVSNMMRNIFG